MLYGFLSRGRAGFSKQFSSFLYSISFVQVLARFIHARLLVRMGTDRGNEKKLKA